VFSRLRPQFVMMLGPGPVSAPSKDAAGGTHAMLHLPEY
jgi:hypothetical protein